MSHKIRIAVVGATGLVGQALLELLADRGEDAEVLALASGRSEGQSVRCGARALPVHVLDDFDFDGTDVALFSAGSEVSQVHAPRAAAAGAVVIDNTSEFRYRDDIPLVVPEVNGSLLEAVGPGAIIANPNCSTIQMVVALAPLHAEWGLDHVQVATYQSVSGAGREALDAMLQGSRDVLAGGADDVDRHAFNVVAEIDRREDNGYTREEMKMHWETCKILGTDQVRVNATAVRVPVAVGHSEAVHAVFRSPVDVARACELLRAAPGVSLLDDAEVASPRVHAAGADPVWVSRVRRDHGDPHGLNLWVVSDNLRKGAALNAVQIMERVLPRLRPAGNAPAAKVHSG